MKEEVRRCRVCGCTDSGGDGCLLRTGKPCHWVGADLCSACLDGYNTIIRVKRSGSNNVAAVRVGGHTYRGSSTASAVTACERAAEKAAAAVRATAWRVERYQNLSIVAGRAALFLEFGKVVTVNREKQIVRDLIAVLDAYEGRAVFANQGQALDGYSALANFVEIAKRARVGWNKTDRICETCGNGIRENDDKATERQCGFCAVVRPANAALTGGQPPQGGSPC